MDKLPPEAELLRTVIPRKPTTDKLPIIAVRHDTVLYEDGTMDSTQNLLSALPKLTPHIFVKYAVADWVAELDRAFSDDPGWQWRAGEHQRDIANGEGHIIAQRVSCVIHFFGWKHRAFHLTLDPITFYGKDTLRGDDDNVIVRLMDWGVTLRDWCHENGLPVKPTNGGLGAALLRDPRFYPEPRRKIPRTINERSREHLPGNHYQLFAEASPDREYTGLYFDQKRAHHYHARTTYLPDANSLYAHGRFMDLGSSRYFSIRPDFYGMYYAAVTAPKTSTRFSPVRVCHHVRCHQFAFIFSNEIPILEDLGWKIHGAVASWGSFTRDTGIPRYAQWAERQLDEYDDAPWLKPILLSTYGVLAVKPREPQFIFKRAKGNDHTIYTGRGKLYGVLTSATKGRKIEPNIANVLHRAMIEAATRAESLGFAEYLTNFGRRNVLSIYADGVIVEDDPALDLPPIPEPWRVKQTLNHLRFVNSQSFISGEMTKLPGYGGANLRRYSHGSFRKAPDKPMYEAVTGRRINHTGRRI